MIIDRCLEEYLIKNSELFKKDIDGMFYLDFLEAAYKLYGNDYMSKCIVNLYKNYVENEINKKEIQENTVLYQKYAWLKNYIEQFMDVHNI